jgi:cell division septum initiation protein DivIVA
VADSRIKGRVRGLLSGPSHDDMPVEMPPVEMPPIVDLTPGMPDPDAQRKALQVLTLAQKTADEHVASAQQQADNIRAAARSSAEQVARDAQAHADHSRQEAAKAVADARSAAEQIVKEAQGRAAGLDKEAQQRYDDVVGTLETKRDALQQRIDELQQFDRDYRSRLRTFMRGQLDALGDEEPAAGAPTQRPAEGSTKVQRLPQE